MYVYRTDAWRTVHRTITLLSWFAGGKRANAVYADGSGDTLSSFISIINYRQKSWLVNMRMSNHIVKSRCKSNWVQTRIRHLRKWTRYKAEKGYTF